MGEGLERHVGSKARKDQERRRPMELYTQVQQRFGKGLTSISPRVDRGDEHLDELAAPLRNSVSSGSSGLSGWSR